MSRRQFAQLIATGALSSARPGANSTEEASRITRALGEPTRLDSEVLGYFRRALTEYYSADKMLGSRKLIGPVIAQIDVLDGLRRSSRPPYVDPLLKSWLSMADGGGSFRTAVTWMPPPAGRAEPLNGRNARAMPKWLPTCSSASPTSPY